MAQKTAKTVLDVVIWLEAMPHHRGAFDGWNNSDPGFFVLDGDGYKLRIPLRLVAVCRPYMTPGDNLDRRMYRASPAGLAVIAAGATVDIGGRQYRRFIPHPAKVDDGTVRCYACGQIDEPAWHDDGLCVATAPQDAAP